MLGESLSLVTTEAQWSFVDGYADMMIARGPTLNPDRSAATGLMHLVDLPDLDAARVFAFDEPNYRASVYGDVLIRRRRNTFGCTMWDFAVPGRTISATLIESPGRGAVEGMVACGAAPACGLVRRVEIHD